MVAYDRLISHFSHFLHFLHFLHFSHFSHSILLLSTYSEDEIAGHHRSDNMMRSISYSLISYCSSQLLARWIQVPWSDLTLNIPSSATPVGLTFSFSSSQLLLLICRSGSFCAITPHLAFFQFRHRRAEMMFSLLY